MNKMTGNRLTGTTSAFGAACLALTLGAAPALADGPCTKDIARLTRKLDAQPGMGTPTSGVAQGTGMSHASAMSAHGTGMASDHAQGGGASLAAGGSPGTVGGVAGTTGSPDAVASGQVATSDQDVRSQSTGKGTAAQQAANGKGSGDQGADDKLSEAKMSLQEATDLNAKGDNGCKAAVSRTKKLMGKA